MWSGLQHGAEGPDRQRSLRGSGTDSRRDRQWASGLLPGFILASRLQTVGATHRRIRTLPRGERRPLGQAALAGACPTGDVITHGHGVQQRWGAGSLSATGWPRSGPTPHPRYRERISLPTKAQGSEAWTCALRSKARSQLLHQGPWLPGILSRHQRCRVSAS